MATTKEAIERYRQKRAKIVQMAPPEVIEKRHRGGQWIARERYENPYCSAEQAILTI